MRLIIAGSRTVTDYQAVQDAVTAALETFDDSDLWDMQVVSGGATGVDLLGECLAVEHGWSVVRYPADWKTHGRAAGPIRNRQMAEYADAAVIVMEGESRGSMSMKAEMERLGKPVFVHMLKPAARAGGGS